MRRTNEIMPVKALINYKALYKYKILSYVNESEHSAARDGVGR